MGEAAERAGPAGPGPGAGTQTGSGLQGGTNHQTQHRCEGLSQLIPAFPLGGTRKQQLLLKIPGHGLRAEPIRITLPAGICRGLWCNQFLLPKPGLWDLGVKTTSGVTPLDAPADGYRSSAGFYSQINQFGFQGFHTLALDLNMIPCKLPAFISEHEEKRRRDREHQTTSCRAWGPQLAPTTPWRKIRLWRTPGPTLHTPTAPGNSHHRSVLTQSP